MADTKPDYTALMWAEVDDIGSLLHELDDEEWDTPSLCTGWNVRDVIGHMCYGHTTPMTQIMVGMVTFKGNVTKGSFELSKRFAAERTPKELLEVWDVDMIEKHSRIGISRTIRSSEGFLDHLIHNQDMRRPLGRPREIPEAHAVAALDLLPRVNTPFFGTKKGVADLRLQATDIDHAVGEGQLVEGKAEAIILAAAGRGETFDELTGPGVSVLRGRVGA